MLTIPVVWVRYSGQTSSLSKMDGSQFFVIVKGGDVLSVMKGSLLFVPVFEASGLEETKATEEILERMLAVAKPTEGVLDEAECLKLGLPMVVEIDTESGQV